jgi:glycosyltransferase involved in cell wall biosynthesis
VVNRSDRYVASVRIALVYDCLYPYTVGGAERWYRNLAERLAADGHDVTYLTLRQWEGEDASVPSVDVVGVGPRMELYARGRRRLGPPLVFGAGVFLHLVRRGGDYEVVHTASFPYLSVIAAGIVRPLHGFRLFVDWFEVWTRGYWQEYVGSVGGLAGWAVQRLCMRMRHTAFCFSRLHTSRLREEGFRGQTTLLQGIYAGPVAPPTPVTAEPVIVFAGRHIPEKRVAALIPAFVEARRHVPELRCEIYGDGPDRPELLRLIAAEALEDAVEAPGFVDSARIEDALRRALCVVLPSRREGYGLVVVEASAVGTPSIVVDDPDNAATELIAEGRNGFIASSAGSHDLAAAILRVHKAGPALRASTVEWFKRNAHQLSLESSLQAVVAAYNASEPV